MDTLPTSPLHQIMQQSYQIDNLPSPAWQYKFSVMRPKHSGGLEAHLLQAPPFTGCKDNHIWDLHVDNPKQEFQCSDRDQLLMALTQALILYAMGTSFFGYVMYPRSINGLKQLYTVVEHFKYLRESRALSSAARAKTKRIRIKGFDHSVGHLVYIPTKKRHDPGVYAKLGSLWYATKVTGSL